MLRSGTRVTRLTKKVGQVPPTGRILSIHGDSVEVEWEDGHKSIISREAVTPLTEANRPHKGV
ncbi:MAG: hypothetical protein QNJ88_03860 [Acidimicrobiia bacterium]|nr:hypothetical protein [Acidimicrobiia bacterium]